MSELPAIRLQIGEEELEATPENSSLYLHLGSLAMYNHVFIQTEDAGKRRTRGSYIFGCAESFDQLAEFMATSGYPAHVNLRSVAECDVDAYNKMIQQQVADLEEPPYWLDN